MKKFVSMLIVLCMSFCLASATAIAADVPGIEPYYLYASDVKPTAKWSGTNSITFSCKVTGEDNVTRVKVYVYLQEKVNGVWKDVDYAVKDVNARNATASKTYNSASKSKDYRAHASVYVYSGSSYEHIERDSTTI